MAPGNLNDATSYYLSSGTTWFYYDEVSVADNYAGINRYQWRAISHMPTFIDPDMEMDVGL